MLCVRYYYYYYVSQYFIRRFCLVQGSFSIKYVRGQYLTPLIVFSPHAGPSGAYSPDATMGYMMDGQQMMHRPPGDPAFHNQYAHYPEYYGHHL